jgi:hypothetical protein
MNRVIGEERGVSRPPAAREGAIGYVEGGDYSRS